MDFLFSKAIAANQISQTLQGRTDLSNTLSFLLFLYFVISAVFAIKYLFLNFVVKNSPDLSLLFFLENRKPRGVKGVNLNIEEKSGKIIRYLKISIFDDRDNIVSEFVSRDPDVTLSLNPGKYEITVEKFGYSPSSTKKFEVKSRNLSFDLKMEPIEQVHSAKNLSLFYEILFPVSIVLFIIGAMLGLALPINYSIWPKILDLGVVVINILISIDLFRRNHHFRVTGLDGKPIRNTEIDFYNAKGDPIEKFTTNQHGITKVFASAGFYKISNKRTKTRTVKINETDFIHLKLKLD
jgi:hypothetical protein